MPAVFLFMRKICFILSLLINSNILGQLNLVPNNSFEQYDTCPNAFSQINHVVGWTSPTLGTPDYFNKCSINPNITLPNNNLLGFQNPYTGNAFIGIYTLFYDTNNVNEYREYISVKLYSPLEKGKKYCLSFFANVPDNYCNASISNIGAFFSTTTLAQNNDLFISVVPQIEYNQIISDTINWVSITGEYISTGGEEYITIGNFRDNSNTPYILKDPSQLSGCSYYFIDDIVLECCDSSGCEQGPIISNVFTPNNDGYNDVFEIPILPPNSQLTLYNRWGTIVYQSNNYQNNWDGANCTDGVYYYIVNTPNNKQYKGTVTILRNH